MTERYYKLTAPDGSPVHGGSGAWRLPRGKRPGAWRREVGPLRLCEAGTLHMCRVEDLSSWIRDGAVVWEAEVRGEVVEAEDKVGCLEARLIRRVGVLDAMTLRLYAADCVERVLPLYEAAYPGDYRPRRAIEATRAYARGGIGAEALAAARAAAEAADRVAWDVAWDAAWAAAWAATWAAERRWQGEHLLAMLGAQS